MTTFEFRIPRHQISPIVHSAGRVCRERDVARGSDARHDEVVVLPQNLAVLEREEDHARFRAGLVRACAGEKVVAVDVDDFARVPVDAHQERD